MFSWFVRVAVAGALCLPAGAAAALPRTADGKPNFQGIWQVRGKAANDLAAEKGVVQGGAIPYQAWAAAKKQENFKNRKTADPLGKCFFPGVPRIMYMEYPFQIFQTSDKVAITFEWSQVYRLISTSGKPPLHDVVETWMGDSRGHWDGDSLVVDVTGHNDKTWLDLAGDFHSEDLKLAERYTMTDADTIQYEVTFTDPKVFTKTWKIGVALVRQKNVPRLLEYQCQAEAEEASGDFERDPRTWYPKPGSPASPLGAPAAMPQVAPLAAVKPGTNLRRGADGKPEFSGYYQSNAGGANYGLEKHGRDAFTPATRGVVIDPADATLPYQPWARAERINRELPYRGYDDPTAHCFVAGVPRSMYVPSPFQLLQAPGYVVLLFERMSWRIIPLDGRAHLPDNVRLWQGDSVGHWEGDTLVVESTNFNGKAWLNEVGDVLSHAEKVVERFTPLDGDKLNYRATVTDPIVYTRPWTIEIPMTRQNEELLEVACHEDNGDLQNLKNVRDEYRAQQKKEK
jgi:hypothetical protein